MPGRSVSLAGLNTKPSQEQAPQAPVGLGGRRLRAVVEPHVGAPPDLADRRGVRERDLQLEDRLQGPQAVGVGGIDRKPTATAAAERRTREAMRGSRYLPADRVLDEVEHLVDRFGVDSLQFYDETFSIHRGRVVELCQRMHQRDLVLPWTCFTRVDLVDRELIRDMARAGCRAIQYGVESGCQMILDSVKGIQKEQVLEAVRGAVEVGIDVASSFMIPFPEDTRETIRETKGFIKQVHRAGSKILLSYTTPYPGTHFYEHAGKVGIKILTDRWDEFDAKHNVMETKYLSSREIDELVAELVAEIGFQRSV